MSPAAQFTAVATLTFAVLGFQTIAFIALGITAVLLLLGFTSISTLAGKSDPEAEDTPEEALLRDG